MSISQSGRSYGSDNRADQPSDEYLRSMMIALIAPDLCSLSDIAVFERILENDPNDIYCRIALLCYYHVHRFVAPDLSGQRTQHILWMIDNCPEHPIMRTYFISLLPILDGPASCKQVEEQWLGVLKKTNVSAQALLNVVRYFSEGRK